MCQDWTRTEAGLGQGWVTILDKIWAVLDQNWVSDGPGLEKDWDRIGPGLGVDWARIGLGLC